MLKVVLLLIYAFVAAIIGGIIMNLIMMAYYAILVAQFAFGNPTIDNVVYWISLMIGLTVGVYLMWKSWPKQNSKKIPSSDQNGENKSSA
jgi:hypothetical protein